MSFAVLGIVPAPYYFGIKNDSGDVYVKTDLRTDRSFQYTVSFITVSHVNLFIRICISLDFMTSCFLIAFY